MTVLAWSGFVAFVLVMLALDLGVVNRRAHAIRAREALAWTLVCVGLALAFNVLVYFMYEHHWLGIGSDASPRLSGSDAAQIFLTGWLVEYSLSLDNIFVIAVIFKFFRVPDALQHRVLFWGVLGALVMRGAMIGAGVAIIGYLSWTEYILGAALLALAIRMLLIKEDDRHPDRSWVVRTARGLWRISTDFEGTKFFTRVDGKRAITPLFLVLLVVEVTDVAFAVDSIPAILGITHDAFLVFTSNVFAILGLRSLYFALAAIIDRFEHLKTSLVLVLAFVGLKILVKDWIEVSQTASLAIITAILGTGLLPSLFATFQGRSPAAAQELAALAERSWRRARRVVILVLGLTVIFIIAPLTGLIPGPGGIPVAIAGLALLATEFIWARRLLKGLKARAQALLRHADTRIGPGPHPAIVTPVLLAFCGVVGGLCWLWPEWTALFLLGASGPALALGYWAWAMFRRPDAAATSPEPEDRAR